MLKIIKTQLPETVLTKINQKVEFQLLTKFGKKALSKIYR